LTTHFVLPDVQAKPGDSFEFLTAIGNFIVDKQPDVLINIGDFADMPSLSSYDHGKKAFEGRRYTNDVEAAHEAMAALLRPIEQYNNKAKKNKEKLYRPRMELTLGNHEERINRAVNNDAKLEGLLSIDDLLYDRGGWNVHDFLDVVVINNVAYSHYFVTGVAGRPASTAAAQLRKTNMSCVAGHQQGLQIHTGSRADGKRLTSIIAGSCYEHDEDYMGPQGNRHWRGGLMLYDVNDGEFNLVPVPIKYITDEYGKTTS
jgi:hypothetical protein